MKALHTAVLSLAMAVLLVAGAFAQDATTQNPPPQNQNAAPMHRHMRADPVAMEMQMMSRRLNLTEDQKAKIQPILQNQQQQIEQIRQSTRDQIKQILTPEQVALLGKGPGPKGMRGNPVEMMSQRLNLTSDQKAKLEPIFANQQEQVQAVKQDTSLTPEQKQAKIRDLRKSTHEQVMGVLTPEQQAQWKQMMQNRMHHRGGPGGPGGQPGSTPPPPPPGF
jgi:Spy/CpxP family protein refolding chaperone